MEFSFYLFGFFICASIGSFYVTLSERILEFFYSKERKNKTFLQKLKKTLLERSSCNHCGQKLSPLNLFPVFGYFFSGKKCKTCNSKISIYYPISELFFGLGFILFFFLTKNLFYSVVVMVFIGHIYISAITDWNYFSLDYENLVFIVVFGSLTNYLLQKELPTLNEVYVLFGFFVFYLGLYYFYKKGIGLGDVLFAPFYAFLSSHPWWMLFLNSSYIIAIVFTILLKKKNQSLKNTPIPMGLYFSVGITIVYIAKAVYFKMQNI
ncbi:MAG: prepilin peptidase [Leptospiraceae bacterium]|nr:prepilin peptidase [Leptospiraceae bacterium]MCK6381354.1 prepilin peptidase [Leptospiraceae bacterium]NUM41520.1 prepilin peptidase [Leptospiraceae bacterium]